MNCFVMWRVASTNAHDTNQPVPMKRTCVKMALTQLEVPVQGMDCAECTLHVQHALAALPGVEDVHVLLSSEKAVLQIDPALVDLPTIRKAVAGAGYTVPEHAPSRESRSSVTSLATFTRPIFTLLGLVF